MKSNPYIFALYYSSHENRSNALLFAFSILISEQSEGKKKLKPRTLTSFKEKQKELNINLGVQLLI